MKKIRLIKGMNKKEVNSLVSEYLEFLDDEYLGSKHKHNWKCKCGKIFVRDWGKIRERTSIKCDECVYAYRKVVAIESHKNKVQDSIYGYIKSYFNGDILTDGTIATRKPFIKIRCKKCNAEFDIRYDYFKNDMSICPCCNPYLRLPKKEKSIAYLSPDIAKMITEDENGEKISFEDCYKISNSSSMKFKFRCEFCNQVGDLRSLKQIVQHGYACPYCRDGMSTPNKFMTELLKALNIDFYSEKTFKWSDRRRYDFYLPSLKMIIEMNGIQHYEESKLTNRSLIEERENDMIKKELALKNGVKKYITIDCRYSTFDFIRKNTIKELEDILNLNDIDWNDVWLKCQEKIVIKTWDLYNKGLSTKEISEILNIGKTTVLRYLHKGESIGKCKIKK